MPFGMARAFPACCRSAPNCFGSPSVFRRGLGGIFNGLTRVLCRRFWPRLLPQSLGDRERVDIEGLPPDYFIAGLMQLPVMATAEWHSELVADFETERSGLRKPQVMRIGRLSAAD